MEIEGRTFMKLRLIYSLSALYWLYGVTSFSGTASTSTISLPTPYAPAKVPFQVCADESLPDATYTLFVRTQDGENIGAWERATGLEILSATQGIFDGTHGQQFEFRSAVFSPLGSEMATLGDFDFTEVERDKYYTTGKNYLFPACSIGGFNLTYFIRSGGEKQGTGCFHFTFFSNLSDQSDIPPDALIGLRFDSSIPVRDWSPYRYLELYYWGNAPGGMDLWIESSQIGFRKPIFLFSQDRNAADQWHSILVDLDRILGEPSSRKEIQTVAFVKNIHDLDLAQPYEIRLDAIRLWQSRNFVKTTIDSTPPSKPENVNYSIQGDSIVWTWDSSRDEESDIAGYSYMFTQDRRLPFSQEIKTATSSTTIPFVKPPSYQEYYFRVSACNKAGLWSPIQETGATFTP